MKANQVNYFKKPDEDNVSFKFRWLPSFLGHPAAVVSERIVSLFQHSPWKI
jgi:hypothetical protein